MDGTGGYFRYSLMASAAIVCVAAATPAVAQTRSFNVPAQNAASGVATFAKQADIQLLISARDARGKRTNAVRGNLTVEQGLQQLLANTGLRAQATGAQTYSVVSSAVGNGPAAAETAASSGETIVAAPETTIVVTAQRRPERLIDVPISVVVLQGAELKKRNVNGVDDLSAVVPGLTVQHNGGFQRRIVLRGLSNLYGSSSLIGAYLDEASVTATPTTQLDLRTYDLQRVEVLRGPQGTLYGEGSVGGTIRFITNDPKLDTFGFNADVAAAFTKSGAPSQRIDGVVNVPLIDGKLGLRVAGEFDHEGGWVDQPIARAKDFNDQNLVDVRAKALWKPIDDLSVSAMAIIHRNDAPPGNGEDAHGNYEQSFFSDITPKARDKFELYNVTGTYDFGGARLLSSSTIINLYKKVTYGFRIPLDPSGIPNFGVLVVDSPRTGHIFTQEGRLSSSGKGPLQWTFGGIYRRVKSGTGLPEFYFDIVGPTPAPLPPPLSAPFDTLRSRSWAVFGDVSYDIMRRLRLGAGLRYFEDHQRDTNGSSGAIVFDVKGKFTAWTPRFYAQYKLNERANIYASASKGFRSGGFNPLNGPDYQPETVWTYELGTKFTTNDNLLSFEGALFQSNYKDYQINGVPPPPDVPLGRVINAGDARIRGVEWSATLRPSRGWTFGLDGTYLDTVFRRINATATAYLPGDNLDMVPKYTFTGSIERSFEWNERRGYIRADYTQTGRSTYRNRNFGDFYLSKSDVINELNLSANVQWSESLSFGAFANNLLNDRGLVDPFGIEHYAARNRPRTLGVRAGFTF